MDQPFIVPVKGGDFVAVPCTFHLNDIVSSRSKAGIRLPMSRH